MPKSIRGAILRTFVVVCVGFVLWPFVAHAKEQRPTSVKDCLQQLRQRQGKIDAAWGRLSQRTTRWEDWRSMQVLARQWQTNLKRCAMLWKQQTAVSRPSSRPSFAQQRSTRSSSLKKRPKETESTRVSEPSMRSVVATRGVWRERNARRVDTTNAEPHRSRSEPKKAHARLAMLLGGKTFLARQRCPAYHSKRKRTNPGSLFTEPGVRYRVLQQNKAIPTHVRIWIGSPVKMLRWVAISCGVYSGFVHRSGQTPKNQEYKQGRGFHEAKRKRRWYAPKSRRSFFPRNQRKQGGFSRRHAWPRTPQPHDGNTRSYVLAISWQAAFCQTHMNKPECRSQTRTRFDATNFSLHGLWPQPRSNAYCGEGRRYRGKKRGFLPKIKLSSGLRQALQRAMPGTQSGLHLHEWYKHGTCYSSDPETYYKHSLAMLQQINASKVRTLFAKNVGRVLTLEQIRAAFDASFGAGAGQKVAVQCRGGLVVELRVFLTGTFQTGTSLTSMFRHAPNVRSRCRGGKVDEVGW